MATKSLLDPEFGPITIRRIAHARHVKLRVTARGVVTATMPRLAPLYTLKQLIESSRPALREALSRIDEGTLPHYRDGDQIGASHRIILRKGAKTSARVSGQTILWTVATGSDSDSPPQQDIVRRAVRKALDVEAKAYLPRRLSYLAQTHGFSYASIRFSNAKGRWGSCSSKGVISLNVALMRLPMEYVDYVLIHELSHTTHLNHSPAFWSEVERCYPQYKHARKQLKTYSPYI